MKMISGGGGAGWRVRMKKSFAGKAEKLWCDESKEASEAAV